MNRKENIITLLRNLKEDYGAIAIKAEFEAEGSRKDELIMLREFVYQAGLGFIIKIGGCEAVHDLDQCKLLDATGIMAPMIETPFAMKKFKMAGKKVYKEDVGSVEWIINAETKTCHENYNEILDAGEGFLTGVTVGRSDLSASMGIEKSDIEGKEVFEVTRALIAKSSARGLCANFGGNIGIESIPFIVRLSDEIERFETRKVILSPARDERKLRDAIRTALRFELEYLRFKSEYYDIMANEDMERIERLRNQLND